MEIQRPKNVKLELYINKSFRLSCTKICKLIIHTSVSGRDTFPFERFLKENLAKNRKQEHSDSTDLYHGISIPGLAKPTIGTDIIFSPLFHIFADNDPDHSHFIFHGSRQ